MIIIELKQYLEFQQHSHFVTKTTRYPMKNKARKNAGFENTLKCLSFRIKHQGNPIYLQQLHDLPKLQSQQGQNHVPYHRLQRFSD